MTAERTTQSFDEILRGSDDVADDAPHGVVVRGTGASNGGFAVGAWTTAALLSAIAAAVVLGLSIRDDEADLHVGFSVVLQLLSLGCLIGGARRVATMDGRRWPAGVAVVLVALLIIALLAWVYPVALAGGAYVP
jgi:hypothetical protein